MKCVSYTRATSCFVGEPNPENVIGHQNKTIQEYMKGRGWKLVGKYSDRKKDKEEDAAFQRMRMDGIARKFEMVVVCSVFRCGRNVSFAEDVLLKTFYPAGIHFAVAEDGFCSMEHTPEEVRTYMRQKRQASNVSFLMSAEREKERRGLLDVHDEKYGYLLKDDFSGFVIDREAAPIIREVFRLLAANRTMQAVADIMNSRGVECPAVHLERVGRKNWHATAREWGIASVQRILQNTAYVGRWEKMVGGKMETVEMPVIVDKEVFDHATKNVSLRRVKRTTIGNRSDNVFLKKVFDKGTGKTLICRRYDDGGDGAYQMYHKDWYATSRGISYDAVMEEAVRTLRAESRLAKRVASLLGEETMEKEKTRLIGKLSRDAKAVFDELAAYEKESLSIYQDYRDGRCTEKSLVEAVQEIEKAMEALEAQLGRLMETAGNIRTAFSEKNPWLVLYRSISIPDRLSKEETRKWVERILVEDFRVVEVFLKLQEWKAYFPEGILKGGAEDGEKEQA